MDMDLHTIWAREPDQLEAPWLIDAWDEFSIEDNPEGWAEALDKAAKTTREFRVVIVRVSHEAILKTFNTPAVSGEVIA